MKFSVFLMGDRDGTYADMADQVCRAEALGFHGAWLGERHLANGDLLWPSPMVAASYLAARTRRIRIGLAARILPFHHPLQVASDALTLDVLSNGRCDLGLSRGSMDEASHRAFNVSREEAGGRFDEAFEVLQMACRGQPFSFRGRHFDLDHVSPSPRPVQLPHPPFYMVANNPRSLDAAADRGLSVFLNGALDARAVAETAARYRARAAGRGGELLVNRFVFVAESDEAARRIMREPFTQFIEQRAPDLRGYLLRTFGARGADFDFLAREICVFGSAETCAERLSVLHERASVEHFLCTFNLITLDHALCVESMERFARDVMPRVLRDAAPPPHRSMQRLCQPMDEADEQEIAS